jgi:hypothetical protein
VDVPIRLLNSEAVTLKAGTNIKMAEPVTVAPVERRTVDQQTRMAHEVAIKAMISGVDTSVPDDVVKELIQILIDNAETFSFDELDTGRASGGQHEIDVGDAHPVRQRLRRQPPAHQAAIPIKRTCCSKVLLNPRKARGQRISWWCTRNLVIIGYVVTFVV